MSILNILFIVLGIITVLITIVAYKRRDLIMEMIRIKQASRVALKELETKAYRVEYEEALREELPRAMRRKAKKDIQRKYDKTPLSEKLGKMVKETQQDIKRREHESRKSGFESIMDDMNVFNNQPKTKNKKKSKTMWDL